MPTLTIYGSNVSDATLTTASDMAANTGGTETTALSTVPNTTFLFAEILSRTGTSNGVVIIPATPTGNGWVYSPGAGTFATGNWSALVNLSFAHAFTSDLTIRFFRWSSGVYTSIGTIPLASQSVSGTKTLYTFTATSMGTITFAAGDLIYVDLWFQDAANVGTDNPTVYESNSAVSGVANDVQVTTSTFTASGGGGGGGAPSGIPPLPFNPAFDPTVIRLSTITYGGNL
jgi:hypothetical protein